MKRTLILALILMLALGFAFTASQISHHSAFTQNPTYVVADITDGSNNNSDGSGYAGGSTEGSGYAGGSDDTSQSNNSSTVPTPAP